MIQRYTFGVIKPDRDSEAGEYVRFEDHQRAVSELLAACKAADAAITTEWLFCPACDGAGAVREPAHA